MIKFASPNLRKLVSAGPALNVEKIPIIGLRDGLVLT